METTVVMKLVEGRLDDVLAVKDFINEEFGGVPATNLRLEIMLGEERVTMTVSDDLIVVRDEKLNKVIATGDWALARLALKGMEAVETETPDPPTG